MYPSYETHVIRIFPLLLCPTEILRPPSDNDADDEDDVYDDKDDDDGNNQDEEEDEGSDDGASASDPFSNRISQAGGWIRAGWIRGGWIRAAHLVTAALPEGRVWRSKTGTERG